MLLLAYDQNCESALSDGLLRLLRRVGGRCYDNGGCRKQYFAGLVVEGHCFSALLGLNRIERDKLRGRLLLNDGDVSFSVGDEGESVLRVPAGSVCAGAGGKAGEHPGGWNIEHLRGLVVAADKDAIVLPVDCKPGWCGDAFQRNVALYFEGLRIKGADLALVFEGDIHEAILAEPSAPTVTADHDRSHNFPLGCIDNGDIVRAVIVGEDAIGTRVVVDAVGTFADLNLLDQGKISCAEHGNLVLLAVGGEAVAGRGGQGDSMHAGSILNCAQRCAGVGVQNVDASGVRDVNAAGVGVDGDVIPAVGSGDRIACLNFEAAWRLSMRGAGDCKYGGKQSDPFHSFISP